jgi:serine phosphatase RsbU (regulator of sigma subunit)
VDVREAPRILGREASQAYAILTRERAGEPEPTRPIGRIWHRSKILFLGLSYKLSPPRRVLFVLSLVAAGVGLYLYEIDETITLSGLFSPPVLLLLALVGLVFVLMLELADRVTVRDELEVARQLQRELLPASAPDLPGYAFAFSYRTANAIGGDYYDFLPLRDGRWVVVVGDASGHGIAAGLVMAIAKASLELAIDLDPRPAAVARMVNRALFRTGGRRAFMTLFLGLLDPPRGHLRFASVGHPYPLLRRRAGEILEIGEGSLPLGVRPNLDPVCGEIDLASGDLLVLYTDGIPEALNAEGASFGFDRLSRSLANGGSAQEIHDRVLSEVGAFTRGAPVRDDSSLVVMSRL